MTVYSKIEIEHFEESEGLRKISKRSIKIGAAPQNFKMHIENL